MFLLLEQALLDLAVSLGSSKRLALLALAAAMAEEATAAAASLAAWSALEAAELVPEHQEAVTKDQTNQRHRHTRGDTDKDGQENLGSDAVEDAVVGTVRVVVVVMLRRNRIKTLDRVVVDLAAVVLTALAALAATLPAPRLAHVAQTEHHLADHALDVGAAGLVFGDGADGAEAELAGRGLQDDHLQTLELDGGGIDGEDAELEGVLASTALGDDIGSDQAGVVKSDLRELLTVDHVDDCRDVVGHLRSDQALVSLERYRENLVAIKAHVRVVALWKVEIENNVRSDPFLLVVAAIAGNANDARHAHF